MGSSEKDWVLLYFDQNAQFFARNSASLSPYRLELGENPDFRELTQGLAPTQTEVLTDGLSYFVLPKSVLTESQFQEPESLDLEALQSHFFSDAAVAAALELTPEALESVDKGSLTYGTTGANSLFQALERVCAGPQDKFLDIGSGCGLPVILASHVVGHAKGVELVRSMVDFAKESAETFGRKNTEFLVKNIRDLDISDIDIDIVYVAATTLTESLRTAIGEKLSQLRPGAVVISLTYTFDTDHLVLVDTLKSPFSWWQTSEAAEHRFLIHLRKAS